MIGAAVTALRDALDGRVSFDEPLAPFTTYRVGGPAAALVRAASAEDLLVVSSVVAAQHVPVVVVGRGSNLLIADSGFDGIVVVLDGSLVEMTIDGTVVRAGGGAPLPVVARRTAAAGLTGFEWAVGVPGTIGGGVRMNAGGHGSDMVASVTDVRVIDLVSGADRVVRYAELQPGFRHSDLRRSEVVVHAELALAIGDRARSEAELAEIVRWRREHQPGGANAGSVFTNPRPESSGRLIDAAGLKGRRVGSAQVSTKHANFIQVDEGGRAEDVAELMAIVRASVLADSGVDLHAETHFLGFDPAVAVAAGAHLVDGDLVDRGSEGSEQR